ncbi:MAG TPA: hypothetical protein VFD03_10840 [Clostridia bacterium]|nr:hypothetical protein [Clostridia bacterium]
MSAALYSMSPVINLKGLLQDPELKEAMKTLMITLVKEDQEFRETVKGIVNEYYVQSGTPNRLAVIDTKLGIDDFRGLSALEGKEEELTIPEQMSLLAERIDTISQEDRTVTLGNSPQSVTDYRADFLIKHMKTSGRPSPLCSDFTVMDSIGFRYFVENVLPEEYRPASMKNLRKIKKDVFENAASRHKARIDPSNHGNKELRLMIELRPSVTE